MFILSIKFVLLLLMLYTYHLHKIIKIDFSETDIHNVIKRGSILKDVHKRYIMYQMFKATKYINFIFSETDLHNVIKRGSILKDVHKRYIMYQMFKATKYLHSGNVIHRDQKVGTLRHFLILYLILSKLHNLLQTCRF